MNRGDMYKLNSLEELDAWANRYGLSHKSDTELNLRRITLLTDALNTPQSISCGFCGKRFKQKSHLLRHVRTLHIASSDYSCHHCEKSFKRKDNLTRHLNMHKENISPASDRQNSATHNGLNKRKVSQLDSNEEIPPKKANTAEEPCNWCTKYKQLQPGKKFCKTCGNNGRECHWCHRPLPERFYSQRIDVCDGCTNRRKRYLQNQTGGGSKQRALNGTVESTTLEPNNEDLWDILQFFVNNQTNITQLVTDRLLSVKGLKWFLTLFIRFVKYDQNNEAVYAEPTFRSINFTVTNASQIEEQIAEAFQHLHNSCQNFERDGSGWSIDKIIKLEVNTAEFKPLEGSSYIPLPSDIQKKKAVLNVQNFDQKCFLWSVLAALHPVSWGNRPDRVSHYTQYENALNIDDVDFPLPLSHVAKFERQNDISINVFGLDGDEVYPLQITTYRNMPKHVNLLLFSKGEQRHYCLVKNMSRLLGDRTLHDGQTYYCNYCLHGFTAETLLNDHVQYCSPHGPQKLSFPKTEDKQWVDFNCIRKQLKVPFVIYADFESFVQPIDSCDPDPEKSSTTPYQKHEPCGFSFLVKCTQDELSKPAQVYRGPNVIDTFFERLLQEEEHICEQLKQVKPMKLTPLQEQMFQEANTCHICEKPLGVDRVRDHDHLSGEFRSAAHSECNLQYQFRQGKRAYTSNFYIPVIVHNLRGYDMHHLMASAGKFKNRPISCIPNNMEKYISFSLGNLRFIDSLQFLNASLDSLVSNLAKEGVGKFVNLAKHFPDPMQRKLLLRKGVFPYDFLTCSAKFENCTLPPKERFYNKLNDSQVSDDDYNHALSVWQTFDMATFADYFHVYLITDVLLLADVFENFRSLCLEYYHLDAAHYYTSPGLAWDAMLKMTGVRLQLLDDIDMVLMVEQGIRGGVSMISKKYAKANNPHVRDYDPSKPKTWITYLDMNNLYGTSMSDALPEKDFEWLTLDQIEHLNVLNISDDSETGYILEVDMDYPESLHDEHSDYPLAPETLEITKDMLSSHTLGLFEKLNLKDKSKKLVPNLRSKHKYVVHYRNLKYYLSQGLKMTKIHRVIAFKQSPWLKEYIDFNTQKRKMAQNAFEKDFFKLMNNAVFGKSMENMRKRVSVELVNTPKRLRKVIAKPNFQSFKIFNNDLVAVNMKKTNIVLNRPIYAGFCILDIAKLYMYQFHYDFIKRKYGNMAQLLFTDTDSLTYELTTDNWYDDMREHKDLFDTSNFPKHNSLYSTQNCKVLGKMKDECGGTPVESFVGLRPKMYSLMYGGQQKQTAKGVKTSVINKELKHNIYEQCLFQQTTMRHKMNTIRSYSHQLYSITVSKITLSPYDDKRYVLDSGIDTLAHGHYKSKL